MTCTGVKAAIESLWARLEVEIGWIQGGSIWIRTRELAQAYLYEFIKVFYNRQRHQAGPDHVTRAEYLARWRASH